MARFKPMKLVLPGIFLLVLGIGNIAVGVYKEYQYNQVIDELSLLEETPQVEQPNTMQRIQVAQRSAERLYQRQRIALSRRDFYRLLAFGGKAFLGLSLVLLMFGAILQFWNKNAVVHNN